jgi:hypothetical protein
MSTPTTVQGKSIPLAISIDDVTFKNLVCSKAHDVTLDSSVNSEVSDCGTHTAVSPVALTMTFQGLINTTPNGATEAGHDEILQYANDQTKIYLKTQPQSKVIKGYGLITNFVSTKATENLMSFSFTFTADGAATIS